MKPFRSGTARWGVLLWGETNTVRVSRKHGEIIEASLPNPEGMAPAPSDAAEPVGIQKR